MTELTLFDEMPDIPADLPTTPSEVFDEPNRVQGHLLIASGGHDYVFTNLGGGVVNFGHFSGPTCELTPDQLRVLGDYCHRMANRIDCCRCWLSSPPIPHEGHCCFMEDTTPLEAPPGPPSCGHWHPDVSKPWENS